MSTLNINADQIYSNLIRVGEEYKYHYYTNPQEKIVFHGSEDFRFAHDLGELKEIVLRKVTTTLYRLDNFSCYTDIIKKQQKALK